ncbi:PREDICTED: potential E3 ubiquitin-protein ligase ariadne-2-like [Amphimedon queenslandica]|uniref:RBR-type E3 ubiquitin transferase n=1 Tax=Amphimedon queenslandica TaxID=400682 RepID=A0A1X7VCL8_AMPQE|nr:PREDICTED: potential E3 ubiquitin-protein ligase ariadne-2-like [Amphimedon queenslandica]|eukprot:XP_003385002.1 PREDICTED: potential E3 ubiquitin-protein ligase ariadne-2-like [Amphimedon queenslandica]
MAFDSQESQTSSVGDYYESEEEEEDDYKYFEEEDLMEDSETFSKENSDPEWYEHSCMPSQEVWSIIKKEVCQLSQDLQVTDPIARLLLYSTKWDKSLAVSKFNGDKNQFFIDAHIHPSKPKRQPLEPCTECPICFSSDDANYQLYCGHSFCCDCWISYIISKLERGVSLGIECMDCDVLMGFEVIDTLLVKRSSVIRRYYQLALSQIVESHPLLRWCPGRDCDMVFAVKEPLPKRIQCTHCNLATCFQCGEEYHSPTDCESFKNWLLKCRDDSETAHYITSNTKDCPKCSSAIEKNGGCNHIRCTKCSFDFCWMCLSAWAKHNNEYYACSRYQADPDVMKAKVTKAREALKKYIFYFERWDNHHKSLLLEEETRFKIQTRIKEQVSNGEGTWIDWQYLLDAADLLRKCRYTLKYTYPRAYWMIGDKKHLFEYQQAQLELEIENLSWKVERATITDRADLERQMAVTEIRRVTLLRDFKHY